MNKFNATLLMVLASLYHSSAQDSKTLLPMANKKIMYTESVTIDSSTKNDLYLNAKSWFAETIKSTKDLILVDNQDSGIIIGKGTTTKYEKIGWSGMNNTKTWDFTVKIIVKDGQYIAEIYDICYFLALSGEITNPKSKFINLDDYFNNPKNLYNKDGKLNATSERLSKDTNDNFNSLLATLKIEMQK